MGRRRQPDPQPPEQPQIEMDFPVLATDVQIGKLTTPEGAYAILNMSTVLQRGTFTLDRGQVIQLGSELLKLGEKMPKDAKPEKQLTVVEKGGLLLPEGA